jgi:hypothetical protein
MIAILALTAIGAASYSVSKMPNDARDILKQGPPYAINPRGRLEDRPPLPRPYVRDQASNFAQVLPTMPEPESLADARLRRYNDALALTTVPVDWNVQARKPQRAYSFPPHHPGLTQLGQTWNRKVDWPMPL